MTVLDINDNAPVFATDYETLLCENTTPGQVRGSAGGSGRRSLSEPKGSSLPEAPVRSGLLRRLPRGRRRARMLTEGWERL